MADVSSVLKLPYILPSQAQKHVTHNEALRILDKITQLVVVRADQNTPPSGVQDGDSFIVASGGASAWAGHDTEIAVYEENQWFFVVPASGWQAQELATQTSLVFDETLGWQPAHLGQAQADMLGINATADTTNRLSLSSPASLFNHEGAGHQIKINKAATTDTASLLYQTGFSGRAEMGLNGNDDFSVKVSADGNSWLPAMTLDASTGAADLAPDATVDGHAVYHAANVVGTTSQTAGMPTGAVIETGSNANGDYTRFADGTMICFSPVFRVDVTIAAGAIWRGNPIDWTYPSPFSAPPFLSPGGQNNSSVYWMIAGTTTQTTGRGNAMSYISVPQRVVKLVAMGRWF